MRLPSLPTLNVCALSQLGCQRVKSSVEFRLGALPVSVQNRLWITTAQAERFDPSAEQLPLAGRSLHRAPQPVNAEAWQEGRSRLRIVGTHHLQGAQRDAVRGSHTDDLGRLAVDSLRSVFERGGALADILRVFLGRHRRKAIAAHRADPLAFNGTIKSLLSIYQRHEDSPFRKLKPGTSYPYTFYLGKLEGHIGERRLEAINGIDIGRWHKVWSSDGKHLAAAAMARTVFDSALAFGVMLRLSGCADLREILKAAQKKLPKASPRTAVLTADQVVKLRQAAHAEGRASHALAYALAFEVTLRLWDVIGQWWPIEREGVSDVLDATGRHKWFGLRWEDVGPDVVLTYQPSKTTGTTDAEIKYRLTNAPMVMEELRHWPEARRTGPVIVSEATRLPYWNKTFSEQWNQHRKEAGIKGAVWARDLQASGITEARASNASADDAANVAGHSSSRTTSKVYDRAVLEAADRFAAARLEGRKQSGNGGGNGR